MISRAGVLRPAGRAWWESARGAFHRDMTVPPVDGGVIARVRRRFEPAAENITVFHVTHHKAGSQWIHRILHELVYDRVVMPEERDQAINVQFIERAIRPIALGRKNSLFAGRMAEPATGRSWRAWWRPRSSTGSSRRRG